MGFSFWDDEPNQHEALLITADGFEHRNSDYPSKLQYGGGIVGTLLKRHAEGEMLTEPYVSPDYRKEPLLAAPETVIRDLGFSSGIAIPVHLSSQLVGIFKLYCDQCLAASVKRNRKRLTLEKNRLDLLFAIAATKLPNVARQALMRSLSYEEQQDSVGQDFSEERQLRAAMKRSIPWLLNTFNAVTVWIQVGEDILTFAEAQPGVAASATEQSEIHQPVFHLASSDARPIASIHVEGKVDGLSFSRLDRELLQEVAEVYTRFISRYSALRELDAIQMRVKEDERFLRAGETLSERFLGLPGKRDVIDALVESVEETFDFSELVFYSCEDRRLRPFVSRPKSIAEVLRHSTMDLQICSKCSVDDHAGSSWELGDCRDCTACSSLPIISATRMKPIALFGNAAVPIRQGDVDAGEYGRRDEFVLPLRVGSRLLGVLDLYRPPGLDLSAAEKYFLRSLCNLAALALYNQRLLGKGMDVQREESRGAIARDIVHALTPSSASYRIHLGLLEESLQPLQKRAQTDKALQRTLVQVREQVEYIGDAVRQQANMLQPYTAIASAASNEDSEINISQVLSELVYMLTPKAERRKASFSRSVTGRRRTIRAVESEVYLILWNLMDNAIKFTRPSGRRTKITIREDYQPEIVRVSIRDQGVGIAEEYQSRIWDESFSTVAPGATRETSGRGLFTVSKMSQRIEGSDIQVTSKQGKGTEFTWTIRQEGGT